MVVGAGALERSLIWRHRFGESLASWYLISRVRMILTRESAQSKKKVLGTDPWGTQTFKG